MFYCAFKEGENRNWCIKSDLLVEMSYEERSNWDGLIFQEAN